MRSSGHPKVILKTGIHTLIQEVPQKKKTSPAQPGQTSQSTQRRAECQEILPKIADKRALLTIANIPITVLLTLKI